MLTLGLILLCQSDGVRLILLVPATYYLLPTTYYLLLL